MNREQKFSLLSEQEESRVDKDLVKNLLLGYFTAASHKKNEVLKLISSILEFSPAELEQVILHYVLPWLFVTMYDYRLPNKEVLDGLIVYGEKQHLHRHHMETR